MTRGPIPRMTPEQQIARHGPNRPNGYAIVRRHPKPPSEGVVMPDSVRDNETAAAFWEFYTGTVHPDHFAHQDTGLLSLLCEAHAQHELLRSLWEEDVQGKGERGALLSEGGRVNPLIKLLREARQEVVAHARTLCLVPAERNRLVPVNQLKKKSTTDKSDELFD